LSLLAARGMSNLLIEGGGRLLGTFFDESLVDEVHVFIAPRIVGGASATMPVAGRGVATIAESLRLTGVRQCNCEGDVYLSGRIVRD
jgi:diaminohydroxyphosphoribosylaminopyrimidine deaminase/5-amino-6-(5-phosphoribosylamino)uracil reductase